MSDGDLGPLVAAVVFGSGVSLLPPLPSPLGLLGPTHVNSHAPALPLRLCLQRAECGSFRATTKKVGALDESLDTYQHFWWLLVPFFEHSGEYFTFMETLVDPFWCLLAICL